MKEILKVQREFLTGNYTNLNSQDRFSIIMTNLGYDRIVVLVDMDCFFCQVETKLQPEYIGKPLAVVQYNQWQLGGIIAVNYEAREYGVTRHMRGEEAKEKCPDIVLASVPCHRGKADTSRYRNAGREVVDVIRKHCNIIERASVDEAYLDITDIVDKRMSTNLEHLMSQLSNTFVVGYSEIGKNDEEERCKGTGTWLTNIFEEVENIQDLRLAVAGIIVEELRADVFNKTGFRCSAGIAQNKILAKLACGLHKPNRQTILPSSAVSTLYSTLPIKKVRNLGGKFGDTVIESLNCNVMGDLLQYSLQYLQKRFDDKTGLWLYNIARGIDNEPVTMRLVSKSIGACKKFPGKQAITSLDVLNHWARELSAEVCERLEQDLEENERRATLATVCYHYYHNKTIVSQSRSYTLNSYKAEKMAIRCVEIISKSTECPIAYLGVSAGKFIPAKGSENFRNFFKTSKQEQYRNTNGHTRNIETETVHCIRNINEKIMSNINSNIDEINIENSELKGNIQNHTVRVQLNEHTPNIKAVWSPTSSRLNDLITSLNERNRKRPFCASKANTSNLNNFLDQNDFKDSFFMNIFNPQESKLKDTYVCNVELIELKDNQNTNTECSELRENRSCAEEENNCVEMLDRIEYHYKKVMNNGVKIEPCSSNVNMDLRNSVNNLCSTTKLNEIFPDLDNIDPNIVALLPLDLQKEAKLYMKVQNRKSSSTEISARTSKGKSKSKIGIPKRKKSNDISSFLVKKDCKSDSAEISSKQCLQCFQMICISKYQEHCDFHVAESLQRELHSSTIETGNLKRKVDADNIHTNSVKRPPNSNAVKSYQSITSFFL